jgi:hypothetical protein
VGRRVPVDAFQLRYLLRTLRVSGATFDDFPMDLRTDEDDEDDGTMPCLLLSSQARPNHWQPDDGYHDLLLRPYSAPRPQHANSPASTTR